MRFFFSLIACLLLGLGGAAFAQDATTIRHQLSFADREHHYVAVQSEFDPGKDGSLTVFMPVWIPGSYLVREFSRHVEAVTAKDAEGKALAVRKVAKNRWQIDHEDSDSITLRYRVYAREMTVRNSYVEPRFAMLNPSSLVMTPIGAEELPQRITLKLPDDWTKSASGMREIADHVYQAENLDELVDSPIVAGDIQRYNFSIDGVDHALVNVLEPPQWDGEQAAKDVKKVLEAHVDFWGELPYERPYLVLNMIVDDGGGLEHKQSTLIMSDRFTMRSEDSYNDWLRLVSHEFFHTWNVKRMHPEGLGPFDYEDEVYTRALWIAEGITSYYTPLLLRRAGLIDEDNYLERLADRIQRLQNRPGRLVRSVELASFDAWIRFYRPDENSVNTDVSYYTKGAVIAFLLDARIRAATAGDRSLDDVMRRVYKRFVNTEGFALEEFESVVAEIADAETARWLAETTSEPSELDYEQAMNWFGLELKREGSADDKAWLGAEFRGAPNLIVNEVPRGTPAYHAGLQFNDELIAIDEVRVTNDQWPARLDYYRPDDAVTLTVARRGKLMSLPATLSGPPADEYELQVDKDGEKASAQRRQNWLREYD